MIQWTDEGIWYEPDQRHVEIILRDLGLTSESKSVAIPGEPAKPTGAEEQELPESEATAFRATVARGLYVSQDRSDIQYAVKELSRNMSKPLRSDQERLKRLGRYLVGKPRVRTLFGYQNRVQIIDAYVDTDYAGCRRTRKSTTGGLVKLGDHVIKSWSLTQSIVTLSSGESEYYGLVRGASVALGTRGLLEELGAPLRVTVHADASAAIGIAQRRGVGKVRQIEVHQLWLQDRVSRGDIRIRKVDGNHNPADALTEHVEGHKVRSHMDMVHLYASEGRHRLAPQLAQ